MLDAFALVLVCTVSFAGGVLLGFDLGRGDLRPRPKRNRFGNYEPIEYVVGEQPEWCKGPPPEQPKKRKPPKPDPSQPFRKG